MTITNRMIDHEEMSILIIKLGGSSITNKSQFETLNEQNIDWISHTLSSAVQQFNSIASDNGLEKRIRIILIHGAGSFGHFHAKEYGLRGVKEEDYNDFNSNSTPPPPMLNGENKVAYKNEKRSEGLSKTRLSVQKLHWNMLSSLITKGNLSVVGLSPFSISPTLHEIPSKLGKTIEELLNHRNDVIPVLHGDCILSQNNVRILGGDKLVTHVASYFMNENYEVKVIFCTDVDGVYTSDPNVYPDTAKSVPIIEVVSNDNRNTIRLLGRNGEENFNAINAGESTHEHDVTGGLKAKLDEAMSIVKLGVEVTIVKCGSECAKRAIKGETFDRGTIIRMKGKI